MQEDCEADGDWVTISRAVAPGTNVRRAGEDIESGARIIGAGTRLGPQHLGLAASVGLAELSVYRRLRVAIFSSGDELALRGRTSAPARYYNSNRYTLAAMVAALGCEAIDFLGIVADTLEATCAALADAATRADLVLPSGGISVGEEDHRTPRWNVWGCLELWQIGMQPGKLWPSAISAASPSSGGRVTRCPCSSPPASSPAPYPDPTGCRGPCPGP